MGRRWQYRLASRSAYYSPLMTSSVSFGKKRGAKILEKRLETASWNAEALQNALLNKVHFVEYRFLSLISIERVLIIVYAQNDEMSNQA